MVKIAVYRAFSSELALVWSNLEPYSGHHVFQCYEWLAKWQETVGDHVEHIKPWIAVLSDEDGAPKAIFPLGVTRKFGARVLLFLGAGQNDYQGPLVHHDWIRDRAQLKAGWQLLCKQLPGHDVKHFQKLPAEWGAERSLILELFETTLRAMSFSMTLPDSAAGLQAKLRSKLRADTKRQRRRLAEFGTLEFIVLPADTNNAAAIQKMIDQKRDRYRSTGVPDALSNEAVQRFYKELPHTLTADGQAHFSMLVLNNTEILATHWGAFRRDRFYFLMPTFDNKKWGGYSPGRLLLENLVEWCIERKLSVFDFTIGGEEYKKDWCDSEMRLYEHLRIVTPLGFLYVAYIRLRHWARNEEKVWRYVKAFYGWLRYGKRSGKGN